MHSRRSFLAGGGAVLASSLLSGCGMLESDGGEGGGWSHYTDWTYETEGMSDTAWIFYLQPSELASDDSLSGRFRESVIDGVPNEDIDHYSRFTHDLRSSSRFEGSFSVDEFRAGYEHHWDVLLEEDGERAGYRMFSPETANERVGITDGEAIVCDPEDVGTFLQAGAGEVDSLDDVNEDFDRLTSELGVDHSVSGSVNLSGEVEDILTEDPWVASGHSTEYTSNGLENVGVAVFETEETVDVDSVVNEYDEDGVSDLSSNVDGRVVTVSYTAEYE